MRMNEVIGQSIHQIQKLLSFTNKFVKTMVDGRHRQSTRKMLLVALVSYKFIGTYCFLSSRGHSRLKPKATSSSDDKSSTRQPPPIPPPPPLSLPVWSLATQSCINENETSMNIVTFASAVSVASPKLWIVSLYHGTLTKDSFLKSRKACLQLLTPLQKELVPVLGKRTGYDETFSKSAECENLDEQWIRTVLAWSPESSIDILPRCACYIGLSIVTYEDSSIQTMEAGDHVVALCKVESVGLWNFKHDTVDWNKQWEDGLDTQSILYTGSLREEGII